MRHEGGVMNDRRPGNGSDHRSRIPDTDHGSPITSHGSQLEVHDAIGESQSIGHAFRRKILRFRGVFPRIWQTHCALDVRRGRVAYSHTEHEKNYCRAAGEIRGFVVVVARRRHGVLLGLALLERLQLYGTQWPDNMNPHTE